MKQNKQNQIIYFFPDPQVGGVEKNFFIISKYLSNVYRQTLLITGNNIDNKISKKIKLIKVSKFWSNINRRLFFIICSIKLFFISAKFKKAIIFSFQGNFYAIIVSILLNKKIIIRSNLSPQGWKSSQIKKKIFKFLLTKANLIIVNSEEFQKEMKKNYDINTTAIFNPTNFKEIKKLSTFKKKIHFFKRETINLINVGRLVQQKNQIENLQALIQLEDSISNFRLLIVGYGSEKEHLQNFINKFNLKKYVKIIFAKNPYKLIKMSDVFISSSKFEGLPNVLLEAAYLNKYIISSNCKTGPKEIIKRYKYGELYKTNNVRELSLKIKKLNKKKLSSNIKNFSNNLKVFNHKENLKKYSNAIKTLL